MSITYFALLYYMMGKTIYCNYKLNFPYVHLESLEQFENMPSNSVCICDDFENWCSSKYVARKEQQQIITATTQYGKRSIDFIWSCKAPKEISKSLRLCIDFFCKCSGILKYQPYNYEQYELWSSYTDAHIINIEVYNPITLECEKVVQIDNTDLWGELYSTTEEVKKIGKVT